MRHLVLIALIFSLNLKAAIDETVRTSSSLSSGLGGAGRAAVTPGDVNNLNPATLAHLYGYFLYSKYLPGETTLSISDNTRETIVPTSLYYFEDRYNSDIKLSLAEKINRKWSLGLTTRYSQLKNVEQAVNRWNLDVGLSFVVNPNLGFGMVGYNLIGPGDQDFFQNRHARQIGLGSHLMYGKFLRIRADYLSGEKMSFRGSSVMFGLENYMNRWMSIRLGYQERLSDSIDLVTLGWGFDLPKFKLDYAYLTETSSSPEVRHSIDLSIPF